MLSRAVCWGWLCSVSLPGARGSCFQPETLSMKAVAFLDSCPALGPVSEQIFTVFFFPKGAVLKGCVMNCTVSTALCITGACGG